MPNGFREGQPLLKAQAFRKSTYEQGEVKISFEYDSGDSKQMKDLVAILKQAIEDVKADLEWFEEREAK